MAQRTERLHGRHAIEEALRARRRPLHRLLVKAGRLNDETRQLMDLAQEAGLTVVEVEGARLADLAGAGEAAVQGALLEAGVLPELGGVRELLDALGGEPGSRRVVALDGVEDPQNVGALARVADAAGAGGLLLTRRRSPPLSPALVRASAGAIEWLPVARVTNLLRALEDLKSEGFWVVAADPDTEAELWEVPDRLLQGDLVVVLGAEGRGLRRSIRGAVDHPVRIPMRGRVASLNVASAGAVVLYDLLRRASSAPGRAPDPPR